MQVSTFRAEVVGYTPHQEIASGYAHVSPHQSVFPGSSGRPYRLPEGDKRRVLSHLQLYCPGKSAIGINSIAAIPGSLR
jgi:hypothetical protein